MISLQPVVVKPYATENNLTLQIGPWKGKARIRSEREVVRYGGILKATLLMA
jgi:hypothetical protein